MPLDALKRAAEVLYERQVEGSDRVRDLVGIGGVSGLPDLGQIDDQKIVANDVLADLSNRDLPVHAPTGSGSSPAVGGEDFGVVREVVPTGGQKVKKTKRPPASKKVLSFKLPTGGQKKASSGKRKTSSRLPTGGQEDETEWLKSLLPIPKTGDWWETPADDKGLKIKYRWRAGGQKQSYVFRRLGKRDIQTLKGQTYGQQVWLIADRIDGELESKGRADIAARISPRPILNQVASGNY